MTNYTHPNRRVCIRICQRTLDALDSFTQSINQTRTQTVIDLLSVLTHDLQTDRICLENRQQLTREYHGRTAIPEAKSSITIQLRLPILILDYLKLNSYKLSSCLHYAIDKYIRPYRPSKD